MEFYDFPYLGNVIFPTDELTPSFFRGVAKNHQPVFGFYGEHGDPVHHWILPDPVFGQSRIR
jgi:hypothetical protein